MVSTFARTFAIILSGITCAVSAQSQDPFTIYNQTKRLPAGCVDGYSAGTDTVLYTIPYTYTEVLSIIGSFKNLTWSGNPPSTVTLNGTDNAIGTSRSYTAGGAGASVIETLTLYMKPRSGPYAEIHTLAPLTIPASSSSPSGSGKPLSFYSPYDANFAAPTCNGLATTFNETINFCATDVAAAKGVLHALHLKDVQTVGVLLGGGNFTGCAGLPGGNGTGNATGAAGTNTAAVGKATSTRMGAGGLVTSSVTATAASAPKVSATGGAATATGEGSRMVEVSGLGGSVVLAGLVAVVAAAAGVL